MIRLDFKDQAVIYPVTSSGYGDDVFGTPHTVPALYEQTTGFSHGNSQDAVSAASHIYLPGDDSFILENAGRLEGMILMVNPLGADDSQQYFRISSVTPARDILLGNQLQHVECNLTKTSRVPNVS